MDENENLTSFCMFISTKTGSLVCGAVPSGAIQDVVTTPIPVLDLIVVWGVCHLDLDGSTSTKPGAGAQEHDTTNTNID